MMNQYRLYTIREWELAQPEGVSFFRFFLTDHSGEVRKVTGAIRYGRCYAGTHNIRKRDYDIPLKAGGEAGLSEKNATL